MSPNQCLGARKEVRSPRRGTGYLPDLSQQYQYIGQAERASRNDCFMRQLPQDRGLEATGCGRYVACESSADHAILFIVPRWWPANTRLGRDESHRHLDRLRELPQWTKFYRHYTDEDAVDPSAIQHALRDLSLPEQNQCGWIRRNADEPCRHLDRLFSLPFWPEFFRGWNADDQSGRTDDAHHNFTGLFGMPPPDDNLLDGQPDSCAGRALADYANVFGLSCLWIRSGFRCDESYGDLYRLCQLP